MSDDGVSESYQAWDNNNYPWPPPDGWYQASDGLWWPQGYGPGLEGDAPEPTAAAPERDLSEPAPAPAPDPPAPAPDPAVTLPPIGQSEPGLAPPAPGVSGILPPPGPGVMPSSAQAPQNAPTPYGAAPPSAAPPSAAPPGTPPPGAPDPAPYGSPMGFEQPSTLGAAPGSVVDAPPEPEKKSRTGLLVGLGVGAAVILVGLPLLAFLLVRGSDSDDQAADTREAAAQGAPSDSDQSSVPPPGVGPGSIDQPWAVNDPIIVSYQDQTNDFADARWTVKVTKPVVDATADIAAENDFNEAPEVGRLYALVPVTLTYKSGPEPMDVSDISFKAIGPSGQISSTTQDYCGVIPDSFNSAATVSIGDSISGNVCWAVDSGDLAELKLYVEIRDASGVVYIDITG